MQMRGCAINTAFTGKEVHLGSWRKKQDGTWYSYEEIAKPLISYAKEKGYNYIEIMPLAEHPCDNSWGYQQTGFYSTAARYGTPGGLRYLIDYAHQNNVGVILDFVPVHFAVDGYALAEYDGTPIYEYPHIDIGINEWGSKNFNHSRGEVQSFLQSNACYWLKEFHFDGPRIDALSNILYWYGNKERGTNEKPVDKGGLGFDYKWDMGWMNDTLAYFKTHPYDRKRDYHKLTFSMMYFGSENFLLPFSHDEVVHGKATILQKMHGEYEDKFPQARALYLYMYTHPGKKLNFMGNEIGQLREWDEKREQDWDIVKYPAHASFERFMKDLCKIYQNSPALYELDYNEKGFSWTDCHQEEKCIYVYERAGKTQKMVAVLNFSDKKQVYALDARNYSEMELVISTDNEIYGGATAYPDREVIKPQKKQFNIQINPFTGLLYKVSEQGQA